MSKSVTTVPGNTVGMVRTNAAMAAFQRATLDWRVRTATGPSIWVNGVWSVGGTFKMRKRRAADTQFQWHPLLAKEQRTSGRIQQCELLGVAHDESVQYQREGLPVHVREL